MEKSAKVATVDIEVFIGGPGKCVSLKVTADEMRRAKQAINASGRNFVSVTDVDGHVHIFNIAEILAITKPDVHNLYDYVTQAQLALQLHEKTVITDNELRQITFGLNGRQDGMNGTMGLGLTKQKKRK
jgi:hypothetical protein